MSPASITPSKAKIRYTVQNRVLLKTISSSSFFCLLSHNILCMSHELLSCALCFVNFVLLVSNWLRFCTDTAWKYSKYVNDMSLMQTWSLLTIGTCELDLFSRSSVFTFVLLDFFDLYHLQRCMLWVQFVNVVLHCWGCRWPCLTRCSQSSLWYAHIPV